MELPTSLLDLEALIANRVQEGLHLEYKSSRALKDRKARKEIAKDVSAFANSDGGVLVYGVEEEGHRPVRVDCGVANSEINREWIEQVISSGIAPKIQGIRIAQIDVSETSSVYAVAIPKSFCGPHQARLGHRYYRRYNFESVPMEDYEISDIRARRIDNSPLVSVEVIVERFVFYFAIYNSGSEAAENLEFSFSRDIDWGKNREAPRAFSEGLSYLAPGKRLEFFWGGTIELLNNPNELVPFDVDVSYTRGVSKCQDSVSCHVDIRDFLGSAARTSDESEVGKNVVEELRKLQRSIDSLARELSRHAQLSGATGLQVDRSVLENLMRIRDGKTLNKINPRGMPWEGFAQILDVDHRVSMYLADHFRDSNCGDGVSGISGVDEDVIAAIDREFDVVWSSGSDGV